jgi:transposase-like protein
MSERRVWRCHGCRKQFSVLTGTPLHGTKVPVRVWVFCIFEMCSSKNGVAAREIERKYGVCPRTAWFLMHRIREMMTGSGPFDTMRGTIVADETWIGGTPARMNAKTRRRHDGQMSEPQPITPGGRPNMHTAKTPVLSFINAKTGEVRSAVIPDVTGVTLRKAIAEQVDIGGSSLWTDEGVWYNQLGREFRSHSTVNHAADEYLNRRTGATTNAAENFFSQLKRSLDGTHHHVSKVHLSRYLAEFDYRYTHRKISDTSRMEMLVGATPMRRLTYKRVRATVR